MVRTGSKNSKLSRKKQKVGVLAGGPSSEREISIKSGRAVFEALRKAGCNTIFLDVNKQLEKIVKKSNIDIAFIALHGKFGEDGTVQRMLEEMKIPYTGSGPLASRLALDKIASRIEFEKIGIKVPKYRIINKDFDGYCDFEFPVVVKPQFEGSSIGLSIVDKEKDFMSALEKARQYGDKAIVEEFISGRELTVGILRDQPLPVIEIVPGRRCYDFFAKYESPDTQYLVPAPVKLSKYNEAQRLALMAHKALGCEFFCRVDMMLGNDNQIYVLEVNTIPGLTSRSLLPKAAQAIGISFERLCLEILQSAARRNKKGSKIAQTKR